MSRFWLWHGFDDGKGEAIVSLGADGLERGGVEAGMAAEAFKKRACADDAWIGVGCVENGAVANDVVSDDDGSGTRELDRPFEIGRVVGFVGVEKDEVEGGFVVGVQLGEGVECGADSEIDERGKPGAVDVVCGYFGVGWVEFECDDFAIGWERACKPDGAVAAEGSDFEDALGTLDAGEQVEEFALVGSDVDRGKTGAGV